MKLRHPDCAILGPNTVKIKEYRSIVVYVASTALKLGLSQFVCEQGEEEEVLEPKGNKRRLQNTV